VITVSTVSRMTGHCGSCSNSIFGQPLKTVLEKFKRRLNPKLKLGENEKPSLHLGRK